MENKHNDYTHIKGWGVDADPENEPTYPMKHYTGDDHNRINWVRPTLQRATVEVLHSNERPSLSAVFGDTLPPQGVSGAIRRYAFKFSENSYLHWLPLILADRVNVVEGIVDDLSRGHIPNIFAEKGWKADLKHNKGGLAVKVLVNVAVVAVVFSLLSKKKKKYA